MPRTITYNKSSGHIIINSIECEIGGQLVDKHYGHWLEVHSQLTEDSSNIIILQSVLSRYDRW